MDNAKPTNPILRIIQRWSHKILTKNLVPFITQQYLIPLGKIQSIRDEILKLNKLVVIEKSKSNIVSVAFIIHKRSSQARFVIDYWHIIFHTIQMRYLMPPIQTLLHQLKGLK